MYYWQEKNLKIDGDSKILIGLGDSFTQGQGACSIDLWEKYDWDIKKMNLDENIDVIESNYKNSWVNKICENYLTDFIPINFGMLGRGNRAAANELYLHPELNLEIAKEKIVVFMLSGRERFDFVHKEYAEHVHFKTIWPSINDDNPEKDFFGGYLNYAHSDKSSVIELLLNVSLVKNWCIANNAKLILVSGFENDINRKSLIDKIKGVSHDDNTMYREPKRVNGLVDIIDWNTFLYPNGSLCVTDLLLSLEKRDDLLDLIFSMDNFRKLSISIDKMSDYGYITKCSHPSYKGHEVISEIIYKHIITMGDSLIPKNK